MRPKKIILEAFKCMLVLLAILLAAFQSSCVSSGQMAVASESRIPLIKGSPHEGSWESSDVTLKYQYVEQADVIQLSVTGKAKHGFDQLTVSVLFLDAQGKVLETKSIYNSGFRTGTSKSRSHKGKIERTFKMPLETTNIAFRSSLTPRSGRGR